MRRGPFVLGVTGNIACGKSTVLQILAERGAETLDADAVYHDLIAPGAPLSEALRSRYGSDIFAPDGTIDRRALGALVFADPAALEELDALTHPAVVAEVQRLIEASDAQVMVVDAVKLVESGLADACDTLWLVTCEPDQQVERLMHRNGLSREEAKRRVALQPSVEAKRALAGAIINNSGTIAETRRQVAEAWERLPIRS
ncbi:MAG: dephospho-CoA kinase [Chloroflexota bacterium]|nr:dephospho-CoA kinase [Chloroflexota bacterium]